MNASSMRIATTPFIILVSAFVMMVDVIAEQVIFTEVNYNPGDGKPEFIEVTNNTATPFDIALWKMSAGVDYTFPDFNEANPRAAFLMNFESIILTGVSEGDFRAAYSSTPSTARVFGPWTGQLSNGGERIALEDKNGVVRSTMSYGDSGKWPITADGAGHTLTIVNPNRINDDYRNWTASSPRHGTPGVGGKAGDRPPAPAITYIDLGATWKFDESNTDLGTEWTGPNFDDSGWTSGPALFGRESAELPAPGIQTPLARDTAGGLVRYYFRKEFDFQLAVDGSTITIDQVLDDGAVYYLNGVEIGRVNVPAGEVTHGTVSSTGVSNATLELGAVTASGESALRVGRNVLAVSLHNDSAGSSDVVFGARLNIGAHEPSEGSAKVAINEVAFAASGNIDWIELYSREKSPTDFAGLSLATKPDFSDRLALVGTLPANGLLSMETDFAGTDGAMNVYLITGTNKVISATRLDNPSAAASYQAYPDGDAEFFFSAGTTRDAPNDPERPNAIVINEIMYDAPSDHRSNEFIELYNRGATTVDLSGWRFVEGVQFEFPGGTTLPAGGYAVVSADAGWFRQTYPGVTVYGDFSGQLADSGELIRLEDAQGDLADEVHYMPGGDWPHLVDGDGSSMELKHPDMDNSIPTAWEDSNESGKAEVKHFKITGEYARTTASTSDEELHFHLVGDAYCILENIRVTKNGSPTNLIENGDVESPSANSGLGWVSQGTHYASHLANGKLHLIADGHGDNKANRTEIDIAKVAVGDQLTIEFDGQWVNGKPRLIAQTFNHSVGQAVLLAVPDNLGTPGALNTAALSAAAPTLASVLHSPVVPKSGEQVVISADVRSAAPLATVEAVYRLDNQKGDGVWKRLPMTDNGSGRYQAAVPEYRGDGDLVQFYLEAKTQAGQTTLLPKRGAEQPAMWICDNADNASDLLLQRFIISARDLDAMGSRGATATYGSKFPRMSNHYFNMTFIANEEEIYYNGEIRKSGSPFTRETGSTLAHGKWKLPGDRLFRGRSKTVIDPSTDYNDRLARFFLYQMGHPINENEWVKVAINDGRAATREDMEPISTDMISRNFEDGSKGTLLRIDDEWYFNDSDSGGSRNADWGYKDSDNPIRYQSEWLMRSQETRYDYTSFIELVRTLDDSRNLDINELDRLMDRDMNCINAAVRGYDGDWDTLTLNRGKNGYFYRKPDGRWMLIHWDGDRRFENAGEVILGGLPGVRTYFQYAPVRRTMNYWLTELLTKYTKNSARTAAWFAAEEDSTPSHSSGQSRYKTWFNGRERAATTFIGRPMNEDFTVTAGPVVDGIASVSGAAPSTIYNIRIDGHPEGKIEWLTTTEFRATGIRVARGASTLTVQGIGHTGEVRAEAQATVTNGNGAPPLVALHTSPQSGRLGLGEELVLDASASVDPDQGALTFDWVAPEGIAAFTTAADGKVAKGIFTTPGVYVFRLTATDAGGESTTARKEITVYGKSGFSAFNESVLDDIWNAENVGQLGNFSPSAWYSLTEKPGQLIIQVLDDSAKPLGLAAPDLPEPVQYFDFDAEWKFDDSNIDLGSAWIAPGYDDSGWSSGKGLLGFETSDLGVPLLTEMQRDTLGGLVTYYLRSAFEFSGEPIGSELRIDHIVDDGVVYYLNGKEIGRVGMPDGEITHTTRALTPPSSNASLVTDAVVANGTGVLVEGTNVLAAELHNETPGSSDAVLGARLSIASLPKSNGGFSLDETTHPWINRALPATGDWTLDTKVRLETLQVGDFLAGLQVEGTREGNTVRYAIGYEDGTRVGIFQIGGDSGAVSLGGIDYNASDTIEVRIARRADELVFSWVADATDAFEELLRIPAAGLTFVKGGPMVATELPLSSRVAFDYVSLVEPSASLSPLAGKLMLSEIMYHPTEVPEPEFLEFYNASSEAISLNGVTIQSGRPIDEFVLGNISIAPGARVVLAKDRAIFEARYGVIGSLIGTWQGGSLANGGERITIVDSRGAIIMDFEFNDRDPWPEAADGDGPSLVLVNPGAVPDHGVPSNWRAGAIGGTPGAAEVAVENSFADWMTANGLSDPLADANGDGLNNLLTFALGADLLPSTGLAGPTGSLAGVGGGGSSIYTYTFTVRNGSDATIVVEKSTDLRAWTAVADPGLTRTDNGDGTSTIVYTDPSASDVYLRARVKAP